MGRSRSRDRKSHKRQKGGNNNHNSSYKDYRTDSPNSENGNKRRRRNRRGSNRGGDGHRYHNDNDHRRRRGHKGGDKALFDKLAMEVDDYQSKQEESNCLESFFKALSVQARCDKPDEIRFIAAFKTAYVIYPSVEAARRILYRLEGKVNLGGSSESSTVDFYQMNLAKPKKSSKRVNLIQDWICDKCDYKNFAKRIKCNKCENPKNSKCKVVYNSPAIVRHQNPSAHLITRSYTEAAIKNDGCLTVMVSGQGLKSSSDQQIKEFFSQYSKLRSANIVRNRETGEFYEVAIVNFITPEDADYMVRFIASSNLIFNGFPLAATYSKFTFMELENLYNSKKSIQQKDKQPKKDKSILEEKMVRENLSLNQNHQQQQNQDVEGGTQTAHPATEGTVDPATSYQQQYIALQQQYQVVVQYVHYYKNQKEYSDYYKAYLGQVQQKMTELVQMARKQGIEVQPGVQAAKTVAITTTSSDSQAKVDEEREEAKKTPTVKEIGVELNLNIEDSEKDDEEVLDEVDSGEGQPAKLNGIKLSLETSKDLGEESQTQPDEDKIAEAGAKDRMVQESTKNLAQNEPESRLGARGVVEEEESKMAEEARSRMDKDSSDHVGKQDQDEEGLGKSRKSQKPTPKKATPSKPPAPPDKNDEKIDLVNESENAAENQRKPPREDIQKIENEEKKVQQRVKVGVIPSSMKAIKKGQVNTKSLESKTFYCFLCKRKFKSEWLYKLHLKSSSLHKINWMKAYKRKQAHSSK